MATDQIRLLVVEDEAYVRESLGALLRGRGYDVTLADGVESAMQALKRGPIDLLLTDLNMPGGGGLEMVKRSRAVSGTAITKSEPSGAKSRGSPAATASHSGSGFPCR